MNKLYGIVISSIAGLSTLVGYLFIYIKGDKNKIISKSLSFAGGVMITLSIIDLIPSGLNNLLLLNNCKVSILIGLLCFFVGFFTSHILTKLLKEEDNKLYKTGLITMLGIMLHNIPEGIATFVLSTIDLKLGILLSVAIILHNIPEGISIGIPIYYSTKNKFKAFIYTLVSAVSEPFGGLIAWVFLYKYINTNIIGILYSLIAGLMIYIGYFELIKTSVQYKDKKNTLLYLLIGTFFIIIVEILLKV